MNARLDPAKFRDPDLTAKGEVRATVPLQGLKTLWFNTGTLCNITCRNCYIDSSPTNDRLVYLTLEDVTRYLDEAERLGSAVQEIGFTGGEPFMNPQFMTILETTLDRGHQVLVLTNAMRPMRRFDRRLKDLGRKFGSRLTVRVSLDHPDPAIHDAERGQGSFDKTADGITFLSDNGFRIAIAGRAGTADDVRALRTRFQVLFAEQGWRIDADDPTRLVLFPEMDDTVDVPEITTTCWGILGKSPTDVMCAASRMVVRRRDQAQPVVLACTLIVDDPAFELGTTLAEAHRPVSLNHPHCAKFCVLGGASCSG